MDIVKTIIENFPELVSSMGNFPEPLKVDIGFINPTIESYQGDGIANDEVEFTAESPAELEELYFDFCKENGIPEDTVCYIEFVD